jgi:hypothetical protein
VIAVVEHGLPLEGYTLNDDEGLLLDLGRGWGRGRAAPVHGWRLAPQPDLDCFRESLPK